MNSLATGPRVGRTIAAAAVVVATAVVAAPTPAAAVPDGAVMTYQKCLWGAPIGADAHEAWALRCRARSGDSAS